MPSLLLCHENLPCSMQLYETDSRYARVHQRGNRDEAGSTGADQGKRAQSMRRPRIILSLSQYAAATNSRCRLDERVDQRNGWDVKSVCQEQCQV